MNALKVAFVISVIYTVAAAYGVYRALMWRP